jgi:hypothetical protein
MMRVDITVPAPIQDDQVRFYVEELRWFEVAQDYGMGNLLLRHVRAPGVCLLFDPGMAPCTDRPLFGLSTDDAATEFARLSAVSFARGGLLQSPGRAARLLEYPLGVTFSLRDAAGNLFSVTQWHPSAE